MELFSFLLQGYRRFQSETMLRTNGKLVALLGPNEAGKSTIITALTHLNHGNPLDAAEVSRGGSPDHLSLSWKFLLNKEDAEAAQIELPRWMTVRKIFNGKRLYSFDPPLPQRDVSHRDIVAKSVLPILENTDFAERLEAEAEGTVEEIVTELAELVDSGPDLTKAAVERLRRMLETFETVLGKEKSTPLRSALATWKTAIEREAAPSPIEFAIDRLSKRLPRFLLFDEDARALGASYDIGELRNEQPTALRNLLDVAGVSFGELFRVIDSGSGADLTTLEHRANRRLAERFKSSWQQSGVAVALRFGNTLLEVQAVNEATQFTPLAERSDGLRQFVALHAFALCERSSQPVLLIDEAEQRLHYNAQADLVQMLAKQQVAPKVIFTTHSAGCLPEDLGNGVRLICETAEGADWSEIRNKFWAAEGSGLQPLLMGMGASTLAFFPTRKAVLVEGVADMLLYPSMFREAAKTPALGFQFVPGLSTTAQILAPLLPENEAHIVYLTDGDDGGARIGDKLVQSGVSARRIVVARSTDGAAVELEDFLDPALMLFAANNLLSKFHADAPLIRRDELDDNHRMASLESAYLRNSKRKLPKVELAYEILAFTDDNPNATILDNRRKRTFAAIARKVMKLLGEVPTSPR